MKRQQAEPKNFNGIREWFVECSRFIHCATFLENKLENKNVGIKAREKWNVDAYEMKMV
jgi:hypothetical protein